MNQWNQKQSVLIAPFTLSSEDIEEYKQMFYEKYKKHISTEEAKKSAILLLLLEIKAVFKPMKSESIDIPPQLR